MSIEYLNNDVVVFKDPVQCGARPYRWWAERGMIRWEDKLTGHYGSVLVRDMLHRLKAWQDVIANSRGDRAFHHEAITAYQNYIDNMIGLCRKAQQQGLPEDPKHTKQLAQEIKAKRQSRMVCVPGLSF